MSSRRKARELALWALYQADTHRDKGEGSLAEFWDSRDVDPETKDYSKKLIKGTLENLAMLDEQIDLSSENWRVARMARVDRSIIRIAAYEIKMLDLPGTVAIDEAVELGKRYGTENSPGFINGVLDSVMKSSGKKHKEAG